MSFQIIRGPSGSGRTTECIRMGLTLAGKGQRVLFIVPEQNTAAVERQIVHASRGGAILNLEIVSFNRLAYKVLDEVGKNGGQILDDTGKNLIVRRILNENKKELTVFAGMQTRQGFVAKVRSALSELSQYGISPEQMEAAGKTLEKKAGLTAAKAKDLSLLSRKFTECLSENYTTAEELMQLLAKSAADSKLLRESALIFDGFTGFTPVQYELFGRFLSLSPSVTVSVTLPASADESVIREDELFAMSKQFIARMRLTADREQVRELPEVVLDGDLRHRENPELAFLSAHFLQNAGGSTSPQTGAVRLFEGEDRKHELGLVIDEIVRLTRTEKYRYRDIAVVTPDLEEYGLLASQMFREAGIPAFVDYRRPLFANPFIEFIRSALKVVSDGFSYASLFRYLKSGMFDLTRDEQREAGLSDGQVLSAEEIAALENYALATGVRGRKRWEAPFVRGQRNRTVAPVADIRIDPGLKQLNALRAQIVKPLAALDDALKEGDTVRDQAAAVYSFLEETEAEKKLAVLAKRPGSGEEYGQLFGMICEILDRIVDLLGDEKESRKGFTELFEASLEGITAGVLPGAADYVTVGDITRSRLNAVKVLFVVGADDESLPKTGQTGGILSDADRERLLEADDKIELSPSGPERMQQERFYLYILLSQPSDRLYVSFASADEAGSARRPSVLFPEIFRLYAGKQMAQDSARARDALAALFPDPGKDFDPGAAHPDHLSAGTAVALYTDELSGSVSAFESFASCPFRYFLQYGLMLEEKEEALVSGADIGTAAHAVMQMVFEELAADGLLTPASPFIERPDAEEELERRVKKAYRAVMNGAGVYGFTDTERGRVTGERIYAVALRSARAALKQLSDSDLQPALFEQPFRERIALDGGRQLLFSGKIDRVDLYREGSDMYVRVVDYKTGSTKYDIDQILDGRQLQLLLYLEAEERKAAQERGVSRVYPAGVHYFHLGDPILDLKDDTSDAAYVREEAKSFRMSGRANVEKSEEADVKDHNGSIAGRSDFYVSADFRNLEEKARQKAGEIGKDILTGNIRVKPISSGGVLSCKYCPYGGVCGFTESLGMRPRLSPDVNEKELLEDMRDGKE